MYGLSNENENYLYKYLYTRMAVHHDKRKINRREIIPFIVTELNLPVFNDKGSLEYLIYEGEHHTLFETNSEFIDNFIFRAEMGGNLDTSEKLEEVFIKGYRRAHKYRKHTHYKSIRKHYRLIELNKSFGASPVNPVDIEGFHLSPNHNSLKRCLEEELKLIVDADRQGGSKTTAHITEEMLEDYLCENIELIEEGLIFFKRQHKISGGFIDILAKDKDGSLCIIELKTSEDKSIIWQTIHYPMEMRKEHKGPIRMITVAPEYSKSIHLALRSVPGVETLKYDVEIENEKIVKMTINSVKDDNSH